jgi:peroxidase
VEKGDRCIPGGASIHFCESQKRSGTPINSITAAIDGSQVYGSSASALRGGGPGEMLVSLSTHGPLLPPSGGGEFPFFLAGDTRVNENPALTIIHTLFVREHNRIVQDVVAKATADVTLEDDALYEFAREMNVAHIQAITFNEILPLMIGEMPPYTGYKKDLGPLVSFAMLNVSWRKELRM